MSGDLGGMVSPRREMETITRGERVDSDYDQLPCCRVLFAARCGLRRLPLCTNLPAATGLISSAVPALHCLGQRSVGVLMDQ